MAPLAATPSRMTGADTCSTGISIRTGADRVSGAAMGPVTGSGADVPTAAGISSALPVRGPPATRACTATRAPPMISPAPRTIIGARRRRRRPSS